MDAPAASATFSTRVVACETGGRSHVETRTVRSPGPGQILVRTTFCGLCGTDLFKIVTGDLAEGAVLGHELVGVVETVGSGAERFRPGQRIVVPHHVACGTCALCSRGSDTQCATFRENLMDPGGFSELVTIRERAARLAARVIPDDVSDEAAVFMEPASCVLRGVDRAGLPAEGGCAVVMGAGSMGLLHLLVLRAVLPSLEILVCDPLTERLDLAATLGAAATCGPGEALRAAVDALTDRLGADAVFDTVGGAAVLTEAVAVTRPGGSVALFAHAGPGEAAGFEINPFFKHERRVIGTYSGGLGEQARVFDHIASGRLDASPLISHRLPFTRFDDAVRLALDRQALKILMVPDR
jgi:L-iditol 2-dehydrogenase